MAEIGTVLLKINASLQSTNGNTSSHINLFPVAIDTDPDMVETSEIDLDAGEAVDIIIPAIKKLTCIVGTNECNFIMNEKTYYGKMLIIPSTNTEITISVKNIASNKIVLAVLKI